MPLLLFTQNNNRQVAWRKLENVSVKASYKQQKQGVFAENYMNVKDSSQKKT